MIHLASYVHGYTHITIYLWLRQTGNLQHAREAGALISLVVMQPVLATFKLFVFFACKLLIFRCRRESVLGPILIVDKPFIGNSNMVSRVALNAVDRSMLCYYFFVRDHNDFVTRNLTIT